MHESFYYDCLRELFCRITGERGDDLIYLSQFGACKESEVLYVGLQDVLKSVDLKYLSGDRNKLVVEIEHSPAIYIPNIEIADF